MKHEAILCKFSSLSQNKFRPQMKCMRNLAVESNFPVVYPEQANVEQDILNW